MLKKVTGLITLGSIVLSVFAIGPVVDISATDVTFTKFVKSFYPETWDQGGVAKRSSPPTIEDDNTVGSVLIWEKTGGGLGGTSPKR